MYANKIKCFDPMLFDSYKDKTDMVLAFTDGMDFLSRWIFNLCRIHLGQRILEIGPGGGAMIQQLVQYHQFDRYVGVELSPTHTKALKQTFGKPPKIDFVQADILSQQAQFEGNDFDSIVSISCLEHIQDDVKAVKRMSELIQPGGKIILYLPALPALYNQADHLTGHYRRYNKAMVRKLVGHCALRTVALRYCNLPGIFPWYIHGRKAQVEAFAQAVVPSPWLTRLITPYLELERHLPLPFGLNLFCVFEKIR